MILFFHSFIAIAQTNDTLAILKGGTKDFAKYYIKKGETSQYLGHNNSIYKNRLLNCIVDFPELREFAENNFWKDIYYAMQVVECYNDYKTAIDKPKADEAFFNTFGLYLRKKKPSDEELKTKQPIGIQGRVVIREEYLKMGQTWPVFYFDVSHPERYRGYFSYGSLCFYKAGFLCNNLKRALGDDKEAVRHIKKYRRIWFARTAISITGIGLFTASMILLDRGETERQFNQAVVFGISGIALSYVMKFGVGYKPKHIQNAVNAYNYNAGFLLK